MSSCRYKNCDSKDPIYRAPVRAQARGRDGRPGVRRHRGRKRGRFRDRLEGTERERQVRE